MGGLPLLIVEWALLEGAAILSGVLFLFVGDPRIVTLGVLVLVFGVVLTFPRPSCFPGGYGARRCGAGHGGDERAERKGQSQLSLVTGPGARIGGRPT